MHKITLIVNAGGQSRRMGQPKALLPVPPHHRPLLQHIIHRLQPLSPQRILVIANDPALLAAVDTKEVIWLTDTYPDVGPLGGLVTGLAHCDGWVIFVACDMPLLNPALFAYFATLAAETDAVDADCWDAVVPVVDGYPEALHALYHRRCLPAIEARLAAGERRAISFLSDVRVRYVSEAELRPYDSALYSFWNANTPEEWAQLLALMA
ncbi:MAG: molybdenum cofactor guanylyltransferase [Caldilineaceae bacterium]